MNLPQMVEALQGLQPQRPALSCAGRWSCCTGIVSMIGTKGYTYCDPCGVQRRQSGAEGTRKLRPGELSTLRDGAPIRY